MIDAGIQGPGNLIYSVSSLDGYARFYERQADERLVEIDNIKVLSLAQLLTCKTLTGSIRAARTIVRQSACRT